MDSAEALNLDMTGGSSTLHPSGASVCYRSTGLSHSRYQAESERVSQAPRAEVREPRRPFSPVQSVRSYAGLNIVSHTPGSH